MERWVRYDKICPWVENRDEVTDRIKIDFAIGQFSPERRGGHQDRAIAQKTGSEGVARTAVLAGRSGAMGPVP
jgi:hypothetical protein